MLRVAFLFSILWGLTGQALADGHVKRIISTGETVLGNKIVYPVGKAKITAFEFTVPVGAPVAPHTHSFPVLLIIQQGEVTLNYGDGKSKVYRPGDAFVEDVGVVHSSKNTGDVPIKALVVAMGVEGKKIMTPVK
jgi:quercetin dioxygenase-like cupin family protein